MKFPCCKDCHFYRNDPSVCDECEDASEFEPLEDRAERREPREKRRLLVDARVRGTISAIAQYRYNAILKRSIPE